MIICEQRRKQIEYVAFYLIIQCAVLQEEMLQIAGFSEYPAPPEKMNALTAPQDRCDKDISPGASDEARTRYLHLGKVALYQMSYTRNNG